MTPGTVPIVGGAEITPVHQGDEDHEGQKMIFTQLCTICQTTIGKKWGRPGCLRRKIRCIDCFPHPGGGCGRQNADCWWHKLQNELEAAVMKWE